MNAMRKPLQEPCAKHPFQCISDCDGHGREDPPAVVTLTRNAPAKIAGQMENPRSRKSATAIPAGAHTGDALTFTEAKPRLILPGQEIGAGDEYPRRHFHGRMMIGQRWHVM